MSGAERCDEILRLIDEVLATSDARTDRSRRTPQPVPIRVIPRTTR